MWPVVARNVHETVLILYWLSNHLHKKGWGVRRKLLAVRFIDRKQALCDKNPKLRASKFSILNHQIGSYKFTRFLIGCRHSTVYQCKYMYITPSRVEPHILYMIACVYVCVSIFVFFMHVRSPLHLRPALYFVSPCASVYLRVCVFPRVYVSGCNRSSVCGPAVNGPLHFPPTAVKGGNGRPSPSVHINVNLSDLESLLPYNTANVPRALGCNQWCRSNVMMGITKKKMHIQLNLLLIF